MYQAFGTQKRLTSKRKKLIKNGKFIISVSAKILSRTMLINIIKSLTLSPMDAYTALLIGRLLKTVHAIKELMLIGTRPKKSFNLLLNRTRLTLARLSRFIWKHGLKKIVLSQFLKILAEALTYPVFLVGAIPQLLLYMRLVIGLLNTKIKNALSFMQAITTLADSIFRRLFKNALTIFALT